MSTEYSKKLSIAQALKQKFSVENKLPDISGKCVFTFAGANQLKKAIGSIIDGFSIADNGNMCLVLALKSMECQIGTYKYYGEYDIMDIINNPNIYIVSAALNDEAHANLFKMADFLIYPSQGEAPGLQLAEAQLCGCIPLATNYTGLPEESCFPEGLITDFIFSRGQFNCYRALVGAEAVKNIMLQSYDFWTRLTNNEGNALIRYAQFMKDVKAKYSTRTWKHTADELDHVFKAVANNNVRIDAELVEC